VEGVDTARRPPLARTGRGRIAGWVHVHRDAGTKLVRKRMQLAHSLDGIVRELNSPLGLPGSSPLNRTGLRPYEGEIAALSARLADLERPVRRSGLRLAEEFLANGGSPLYDRMAAAAVPRTVRTILAALEPR
jgi:hypothetical protein